MAQCQCKRTTRYYCFEHKQHVCNNCVCDDRHAVCFVKPFVDYLRDKRFSAPTCPLCSGAIEPGTQMRLPCFHLVHAACLSSAVAAGVTSLESLPCPVCSVSALPDVKDTSLIAEHVRAFIRANGGTVRAPVPSTPGSTPAATPVAAARTSDALRSHQPAAPPVLERPPASPLPPAPAAPVDGPAPSPAVRAAAAPAGAASVPVAASTTGTTGAAAVGADAGAPAPAVVPVASSATDPPTLTPAPAPAPAPVPAPAPAPAPIAVHTPAAAAPPVPAAVPPAGGGLAGASVPGAPSTPTHNLTGGRTAQLSVRRGARDEVAVPVQAGPDQDEEKVHASPSRWENVSVETLVIAVIVFLVVTVVLVGIMRRP